MPQRNVKTLVLAFIASALTACAGGGATSVPSTVQQQSTSSVTSKPADAVERTVTAVSSATVSTPMTSASIDAGMSTPPSGWMADTGYSMTGSVGTQVVSTAIATSRVTNPAPQAVYQSQRFATHLTYTLSNLVPLASYTVRLHFVESYFNAAGKRIFNISNNGVLVQSGFDIFSAAGGANIAYIKQVASSANASGTITIKLDATVNNASIAGIQVGEVIASPTPSSAAIDAGDRTPPSGWMADTGYSTTGAAGTDVVSTAINTSRVTDPAPQAVYQTQRFATHLTYTLSKLVPLASYNVRLHFVEIYFNAAGKRLFNISNNGVLVQSGFDIFSTAGGANIAYIKQFASSANASGTITIKLDATVNNASIAGIQVSAVSGSPTPVRTAAPTPIASPTRPPVPTAPPTQTTSAQPGYGPRVPVGPQASISCPAGSVNIAPGTNVQSVVNAHAAGTIYCLGAGTFSQQQITPKLGDAYIGVKGAIFDGQNTVAHAFFSSASNVTIKNLIVKNYKTPLQEAPIIHYGGSNWVLQNNEVSNNSAAGVYGGSGDKFLANYLHNNGQEGYKASGTGEIWTDNEISFNNPTNSTPASLGEAGGGKAWKTIGLRMEYNYVHDNVGPGLWDDNDNQGTVLAFNDVENNSSMGILHEISWDATIANNYLKNNSSTTSNCQSQNYWCGEIQINNSGGVNGKIVDVYRNTVIPSANGAGVMLMNQTRTTGLYGVRQVQNVHVHNNTVKLVSGALMGAVNTDGNNPAMFTSQGNSFSVNSFTGADSTAFRWKGGTGSFTWFQSQGQEAEGSSN